MKTSHLSLMCCPACNADLNLFTESGTVIEDSIYQGILECSSCLSRYPIIHGVGVFFKKEQYTHYLNANEKQICKSIGFEFESDKALDKEDKKLLSVTRNWSYQWNEVFNYSESDLSSQGFFGADKFRNFIRILPESYKDKTVAIWCGGKGREAYHISGCQPSLLIVNEIGDEIYGIPELLPVGQELLLIRCDILHNPFKAGIADVSVCDHALQHIADHKAAFQKIVDVLKPGGTIGICVYSHENNFLMTHVVEPMKSLIHLFPLFFQRVISLLPALIIYFAIHSFYLPLQRVLSPDSCRKIPYFEHMIFWSQDSLNFIWMACFDLIHAPISYHFRKHEIEAMAQSNRVQQDVLENTHTTTWSLVGHRISG